MTDVPGEGLRERKKRLTRQQISDTATGMFLAQGFDEVRVADVAAACGVSEKTVYNYFPTKESLLLDREPDLEAALRRALGPDAPAGSPVQAVVDELVGDLTLMFRQRDHDFDGFDLLDSVSRFTDLVDRTPALRAAQRDMMERLVDVAAEALAERAGVAPVDPEPRIAATAIVGLWTIQFHSMKRYADGTRTPDQVRAAVAEDVLRAARLIETGLWSFSATVQGATSRQQFKAAGEAANEARKQVLVAIKAARQAWMDLAAQHEEYHQRHPNLGPGRGGGRAGARQRRPR